MTAAEAPPDRQTATIGVDLGGTGTRMVALDAQGTVLRHKSFATATTDATTAVRTLISEIRTLAADLDVSGVAIGASGPVTADGLIDNPATMPAYSGIDLRKAVEEKLGWRCRIENDAAAAAIGEYYHGASRSSTVCTTITLGTGVGVAVIADGLLLRGSDGVHPEAGHIAVPDAPSCYCGLQSCWEQIASRTALEAITEGDLASAATAARRGHSTATRTFERYGRQVAAGLGTLLTVFRPETVVIGGSAAQYLDLFSKSMTEALRREPPFHRTARIVPAQLGDLAGAIGAAELARH